MLASASIKRMVNGSDNRADPDILLPPGLQQGKGFDGTRRPSLIERAASAAGELLGPTYGTLVYSVLKGCKDGQMSLYLARILLERSLPESRPTPVQLPLIDCAADLVEADRRLMAGCQRGGDLASGVANWPGVHPGVLGDQEASEVGRAMKASGRMRKDAAEVRSLTRFEEAWRRTQAKAKANTLDLDAMDKHMAEQRAKRMRD